MTPDMIFEMKAGNEFRGAPPEASQADVLEMCRSKAGLRVSESQLSEHLTNSWTSEEFRCHLH